MEGAYVIFYPFLGRGLLRRWLVDGYWSCFILRVIVIRITRNKDNVGSSSTGGKLSASENCEP